MIEILDWELIFIQEFDFQKTFSPQEPQKGIWGMIFQILKGANFVVHEGIEVSDLCIENLYM